MYLALMSLLVACLRACEGSQDFASAARFLLPPRQPRIYARAPSGVGVTRVRAVYTDEKRAALPANVHCDPRYYLLPLTKDDTEELQFTLDECEGIIRTNRSVEKNIGDSYTLKVVAKSSGYVILATLDLVIEVTKYNNHSPYLTGTYNSLELFEEAKVGTLAMRLQAHDIDPESYNKELFYFLQDPQLAGKDPWLFPTTSPLNISTVTGDIMVSEDLRGMKSPLFFYVGVGDGGSPHRLQTVKMVLDIRKMSAPVNASVDESRKTMALICWSPPERGKPLGYILSYIHSYHSQQLNLSNDDLFSHGVSHPNDERKTMTHCYRLGNLVPYTHYIINLKGWNENGVSMELREPLTIFTSGRVCTDSLCGNGICQESNTEPGYSCVCTKGYYGHNCQLKDPCVNQRDHDVTCDNGCLHSRGKLCLCTSAISDGECPLSSRCFSHPACFTGKQCASTPIKDFYCYCNLDFEGKYCPDESKQSIMNLSKCEETATSHLEGNLVWPQTLVGGTIVLPCPSSPYTSRVTRSMAENEEFFEVGAEMIIPRWPIRNPRSTKGMSESNPQATAAYGPIISSKCATRKCQASGNNLAQWLSPDLSGCRRSKTTVYPLEPPLPSGGQEWRTVDTRKEIVEKSITKLLHFTRDAYDDPQATSRIGEALDVLLVSNMSLFDDDDERPAVRILNALRQYAANVSLQPGENITLKTPNVVVETRFLSKDDIIEGVSFRPSFEVEIDQLSASNDQSRIKDTLQLTIPKEALDSIEEKEIRFQFVTFKDGHLFQEDGRKPLNMPVILAAIVNHPMKDLKTPILYNIPLPDETTPVQGVIPTCIFWEESKNRWSGEGLKLSDRNDGKVLCHSNHLTAFSVLLDPTAEDIHPGHQAAFSFITYAGLTLSTASLLLTIATFALFRCLNRDRSGAIVMNLSLALLLLNISFIGASVITPKSMACIPFAALVHYSVTASFTWMLIEALNMHSLLVTVFPSVETHFMAKRVTTGWGFPVILVAIALVWNREVYKNRAHQLCFLSPLSHKAVYYFTYFAPICIVLGVNCVVFVLVCRVLFRRRLGSNKQSESPGKPSHKRFPVTLAQIRGAITVVALLGVTWIAGALSVGSFRVFFQYLFCITTPLQGFIIFFVRVIQSAEARAAWYAFLTTGSRNRRHRHPISSLRTNSSSQNTPSVNTQSTGFVSQKNVFASAMKLARRLSLANESQQGTSNPLNSSTLFARKGKTLGEKWSLGSFQRNRKKSQKENEAGDDRANDPSQKFNKIYGLYFQPESDPEPLTPPLEECLNANNSLLGNNSIDLLTTDVIPFEKEPFCVDEKRSDALVFPSSEANPSMARRHDFRGDNVQRSVISLEEFGSMASQSPPFLKNNFKKDFTI